MNAIRSKVVIHDSHQEPVVGVAVQLLNVLGHDVTLADNAEAAMDAASKEQVDLLVLNVTDPAEQSVHLDRLALLPKAERPKQIAILSDADVEAGPRRFRNLPDVKVYVFVKQVHALGLLNVIKRMTVTN